MISILVLIWIVWAMLFTITRFFRYYKIVNEYKEKTTAKVIKVSAHQKTHKKEKLAVDVLLEHDINGKVGHSEVVIPAEISDQYTVGTEVAICYKVSGNGAVHIASDTTATKKLMKGYAAAIAVEFIAFVILWWYIL